MPGYRGSLEERFWRYVSKQENGCWMWMGARSGQKDPSKRYGMIGAGGRGKSPLMAHRVSYELFVGKIPEGHYVDHLCYDSDGYSNRLCVNPDHLQTATPTENARLGYVAKRKAGTWVHYSQGGVD